MSGIIDSLLRDAKRLGIDLSEYDIQIKLEKLINY
jgi:hypothetical protein